MGQKIHPTGFRLPVTRNWSSRWYASNKNFATMLAEDLKVREYLKTRLKNAAVSRILIERPAKNARITIYLGAAGRGHRQEGRGHREPQGRADAPPGRAGGRQHRGSAQARDRCPADRRLHHPAAREADHVPPRDEAGDAERDAPRRAGHQADVGRAAERHRDRADRVVPRRPRAAAHAEGRHRLRLLRSQDHLRRHRREVLGLPRRPARQRRSAEHQHAGRRRRRSPQPPRPASGRPGRARRPSAFRGWPRRRPWPARPAPARRAGRRRRPPAEARAAPDAAAGAAPTDAPKAPAVKRVRKAVAPPPAVDGKSGKGE